MKSYFKIAVVSGYFNPLHVGHLKMMQAARLSSDHLIVVVNNDAQVRLKCGRVIVPESERVEIVRALRVVDTALISRDVDRGQAETLRYLRKLHPLNPMAFCNGGDVFMPGALPEAEVQALQECGYAVRFGVGGFDKANSSSAIRARLAEEKRPEAFSEHFGHPGGEPLQMRGDPDWG